MNRAARWVEIGVGAFFLVSAAAKAVDMDAFGVQVSAYNVVKDAGLVRASAYLALSIETLLGVALVAGIRYRGLTHFFSAGMVAVYSALIAYAWQFHGLEDCGCLGQWISMGPIESLIKNAILVALIGFAWYGAAVPPTAQVTPGRLARAAAAAGMGAVFALAAYDLLTVSPEVPPAGEVDAARPFAQFAFEADGAQYDLGRGEYLVAMLNATCEHCRASVPALNDLFAADEMPEMIALMMGSEKELAEFRTATSPLFATHRIEPLKFMEFIGTSPPRLILIRDGREVRHWDWTDEVPAGEIQAAISNGG